jgi:hypothetical protein
MTIYSNEFKVVLKESHPKFFELEYGLLHVWVCAESPEAALERSKAIVEQLPYEILGSNARVSWGPLPITEKMDEIFAAKAAEAKTLGMAIFLCARLRGQGTEEEKNRFQNLPFT